MVKKCVFGTCPQRDRILKFYVLPAQLLTLVHPTHEAIESLWDDPGRLISHKRPGSFIVRARYPYYLVYSSCPLSISRKQSPYYTRLLEATSSRPRLLFRGGPVPQGRILGPPRNSMLQPTIIEASSIISAAFSRHPFVRKP